MKKFPSFLAGVLTTAIIGSLSISALAASGIMTISVNPINIQVNGETFAPKDVNGKSVPVFAYNGTTYAPLRALAEAYGLEVGYDATTNMATVNDPDYSDTNQTSTYTPTYTGVSYQELPGIPDFGKIYNTEIQSVVGPLFLDNTYTIGFQYDNEVFQSHTSQYETQLIAAGFKKQTSGGDTIFINNNVAVTLIENTVTVIWKNTNDYATSSLPQYSDVLDIKSVSNAVVKSFDSKSDPGTENILGYSYHTFFYHFPDKQTAYLDLIKYMIALKETGCVFVARTESNTSGVLPIVYFLSKDKSHLIEIKIQPMDKQNETYMTVELTDATKYTANISNYSGSTIPDFGDYSGESPLVSGNTYGYLYKYPTVTVSSPKEYAIILAANGFELLSTTPEIYNNSPYATYIFQKNDCGVSFKVEKRDGVTAFLITLHR